jgi:tol-pal system protein YbgF
MTDPRNSDCPAVLRRPAAGPPRATARGHAARASLLALLLLLPLASGGCYTRRMARMECTLDTLRWQVDSLHQSQSTAWRQIESDLQEQRDLMLSLKAGTNVASNELVDRIEELSAKLDDTVDRVSRVAPGAARAATPADTARTAAAGGLAAEDLYEQAARDFTQGRFEMALVGFRTLAAAYPDHELADNALYGVGESYYALARYDSAGAAYREVESRYPRGDRVPAALYKLGMVHEKLGDKAEAQRVFEHLREKFPRSGEAKLAEERLRELARP